MECVSSTTIETTHVIVYEIPIDGIGVNSTQRSRVGLK